MILFGCKHRDLSRVFTLSGQSYRACLDCGVELEYSLSTMQLTGRAIERAPQKPDEVAIARASSRKFLTLEDERTPALW